ncbi:breast cancer anti-estrogen resistance protein 1 [Agrilus planipennis]|uniref:Breast cancer anti-estrogen resistance protein 1 n=1 Tax=Agrilus planipennis TaxID=224129 RepID=A0A1W4XDY5_AGRPL|nr:breast cancer anti-estrogen resistance protein 1 [Agrilus planipennis]
MPIVSSYKTNFHVNCLARALYDNVADSPDELAFRKGDVLVVLEQNAGGNEGWWLCTLRGRQGICPGNRLRLIAGVYEDTGQSRGASPLPQFPEVIGELNTLQRQGKRRSWHVQPNKVLTPKKYNDVYLYDVPPRAVPISYDVPGSVCYDAPRSCSRCSPAPSCASPASRDSIDNSYDIPRPTMFPSGHSLSLTPSSSASSLTTVDSLGSSNRNSISNMPDYDVPRSHPKGPQLVLSPPQNEIYDVPSSNPQLKELPLELGSALEILEKLQTETTASISKLLGFVSPHWRTKEKLEANIMDIKLSVIRLRTSLRDLMEFCVGALGNATRASDKNLAIKITPLVGALQASDKLVYEASNQLQSINWSVEALAQGEDADKIKPDALEQLIACARALTEDVRQATSFIQGNSTLLFKRNVSTPLINNNEEAHDDYDYVKLESKEEVAKKQADIRNCLPDKLKKGYDTLVKNANESAMSADAKGIEIMDQDDKKIILYFATQAVTHHNSLTQAIDAFLQTVEHNQPPKVFLAHGKFVVLSAHKMVHIGDVVHRNITNNDLKMRVLNFANALSDALASSVNKTKQAALQFPSVTAVQEMVDAVVDISHLARDLKLCLLQAAQPYI